MAITATPAYVRTNVVAGQARMFLQKLLPTSVPALPLDAIALNGAWPATGVNIWVPVGATLDGMHLKFQRSTQDITIEEQLTPVIVNTTAIDMGVDVTLSEDTINTMLAAYGGGTTSVVAAASGIAGKTVLTIGSDQDSFAFGFEAVNSFGLVRRVMIPSVVSVGQAQTLYRRAADARRYAVTFRATCAPESVIVNEWTAAPLP
jgi:hypothetical protein